jgi:hypothetical protein
MTCCVRQKVFCCWRQQRMLLYSILLYSMLLVHTTTHLTIYPSVCISIVHMRVHLSVCELHKSSQVNYIRSDNYTTRPLQCILSWTCHECDHLQSSLKLYTDIPTLIDYMMGWDVSELLPLTDILFIPQMIYEYGEWRWNDFDEKTKELWEKHVPVTLPTTNPTWIDPGMNPGLCGERLATNRLSHGTAYSNITSMHWGMAVSHLLEVFWVVITLIWMSFSNSK